MKRNSIVALAFMAFTACGDSSAEGGGGSDSGPAGPGSGPGPTTTGTGAGGEGAGGASTSSTGGIGGVGGTGGTGATDCFLDPMVHVEIINGCTDALQIDKVEQVGIWDEGEMLPALP